MQTDIRRPRPAQSRTPDEKAQGSGHHISIPIIRNEVEREQAKDDDDDDDDDKNPLMVGTSIANHRTKRDGQEQQDKRIAIPIRVEPKVYFANERTFLSWIHFSIFLGGVSTALVGLGNEKARTSGFLFGAVSILFTLYALYLYRWRAARIRQRDPGPYDDLIGPTLVSGVFLLAMLANIIFSWTTNN